MSLSLKTNKMSRIKQNQIIDNVILSIASIIKNQCSLSEQDLIVLNKASEGMQFLKRKKGKTNGQILNEVSNAIEPLNKFFLKN